MATFDYPRRNDPTQPYAPPAFDDHDSTWKLFGDSGPWTWLLAEAWQQAAAPDHFAGSMRRPLVPYDGADRHFDVVAYWAPLVSLMHHGLGWRRPDIGLWHWRHEGERFDDPVLTTLDRRYGSDLDLMMAWLVSEGSYLHDPTVFEDPVTSLPPEMKRYCDDVRSSDAYVAHFGGGNDPHHFRYHVQPQDGPGTVARILGGGALFGGSPVDLILSGDCFHDLFRELRDGDIKPTAQGRSARVALVWPTGGWLGTYRRSRKTGRWFRGRHAVHELGIAP